MAYVQGQEFATQPVDLEVDFNNALGERQERYELLQGGHWHALAVVAT